MSTINVLNMTGEVVGTVELSDGIFGIEPNEAVVHEVVKNHLANCRQGTQSALTRGEVSGGGKKPWRQKGTGHARQGSTRAPQWTHGGIVFAPKPRSYSYVLNKKVKRLAMKSALSAKAAAGEIIVVDSIKMDAIKTKDFRTFLGAALLVAVLLLSRQELVGRKHIKQSAALFVSGAALGISWIFLFRAYQVIGVGTSTLLYYLGPVIVMALAPVLLHERLGAAKLACFGAVVLGAFLVVSQGMSGAASLEGVLCGLGAAAFYAVMVIAGMPSTPWSWAACSPSSSPSCPPSSCWA